MPSSGDSGTLVQPESSIPIYTVVVQNVSLLALYTCATTHFTD